ncbi:calcium homeostasis modulator protein 5 [Bufo gargarizans]|uniref:calcium homeostasis modulator protein 5 n=1 Tax=Bufo gargarizans TaxID=30331 RepID=UPI001CF5EF2F|nr:calcium homeostasis modulator protein 5 [Bufo gargarizans]
MDALHKLLKLCADKKSAIGYGFLTILTAGGQHLFSLVVFQCPCTEHNLMYGCVFLFAPAVVLMIISYFLNSRTWKFVTGCCLKPKKMCPNGYRCYGLHVFLQLLLNSLIVPVMWISIALLHGTFYTCAMSAWQNAEFVQHLCRNKSEQCQTQLYKVTCGRATLPAYESQEVVLVLQAQSQVLGWCLIAVLASISLLCTCWSSCYSKVSSIQMSFWKIYIEKEKDKFDRLAQEYADKLAERNLRSFFENKEPTAFELPNNKAWEKISALYTFNADHQYYSTLHKFVEHGVENFSGKEVMMDFVDAQV